jgi:hypothetical protein
VTKNDGARYWARGARDCHYLQDIDDWEALILSLRSDGEMGEKKNKPGALSKINTL